jgi:CRP/FNR family transcriptional regulator
MTRDTRVVQFPRHSGQCETCDRAAFCLGQGLSQSEMRELLKISATPKLLKRGQELFSESTPFDHLYAVRSGAIKTYKITPDGDEQIIDFHLPGDLIGFNAIACGEYTCHAVALDTTGICAIRFEDLSALCMRSLSLQQAILKRISASLAREEEFLVTIGTKSATQRLASFLVTLSNYYGKRGFSAVAFTLPMSRTDIANYLSLAVETVSRTLTRLQQERVIAVKRNSVDIKDRGRLHTMAGCRLAEETIPADMIN